MTPKLTGEGASDADVKNSIDIFGYKQRLLSLDIKTKFVQHVPRIIFNIYKILNILNFNFFKNFKFFRFPAPVWLSDIFYFTYYIPVQWLLLFFRTGELVVVNSRLTYRFGEVMTNWRPLSTSDPNFLRGCEISVTSNVCIKSWELWFHCFVSVSLFGRHLLTLNTPASARASETWGGDSTTTMNGTTNWL